MEELFRIKQGLSSGQGPCQCGQNFTILLRTAGRDTVLDKVNSISNPPKDSGACAQAQSCPALSDLMDCRPLGSSVLLQGMLPGEHSFSRVCSLENILFSGVRSQPRDRTLVSCITGRFFTTEPSGETQSHRTVS